MRWTRERLPEVAGFAKVFLLAGLAFGPVWAADSAREAGSPERFRVLVDSSGVHRIDHAMLAAVAPLAAIDSATLGMTYRGRPLPIHVEDGGDGRFDPGDALYFIGHALQDVDRHAGDHASHNVYQLTTMASSDAARFEQLEAPDGEQPPSALRRSVLLEQDLLRATVAGRTGSYADEPLWYWLQLNHLASQPTRIPVELHDLDRRSPDGLSVELAFRGGSDSVVAAALGMPDHLVEIALNDTPLGAARWSGRGTHTIRMSGIDPAAILPDGNRIELRVPARALGETGETLLDVVQLDWIRLEYPASAERPSVQQRLIVPAADNSGRVRLESGGLPAPALFGEGGFRARPRTQAGVLEYTLPAGDQTLWIAPEDALRRPARIELMTVANLRQRTAPVDYFMIGPADLLAAVAGLEAFHRSRGLRTEAVDVQHIYDEFSFGLKHPEAIRAFLRDARASRAGPAPRFVLLVGDASWYVKRPPGASEEQVRFSERDRVPAWTIRSRDGPVASDQPYVLLEGDDLVPDMAIGRFPVHSPDEARAMAAKTVEYLSAAPDGDWRARVVLASDHGRSLATRNERLADAARAAGLQPSLLLPEDGESGDAHQARMRRTIEEGALLLHFFGHGGRYMWQTAPASGGSAANLFDMEDLDRLAENQRLPVVLSMSCNTGPFDHPAADSLAEKFVRMPERGAVAMLAASARNSPSLRFTNEIVARMLAGEPIGQAIQAAKAAYPNPDVVYFYNLFGDPALRLALPDAEAARTSPRAEPAQD